MTENKIIQQIKKKSASVMLAPERYLYSKQEHEFVISILSSPKVKRKSKIKSPGSLTYIQHQQKLKQVFSKKPFLDPVTFLTALSFYYDISYRDAEKNYRPFLRKQGYIKLDKSADTYENATT